MDAFTIKQFPAKEQAELRVRIKIPGSWFKNLRGGERAQSYECEAYDFEAAYRFPKDGARAAHTSPAIKFLSKDDVAEDANLGQFIIPLADWNRYRHETFKDNRNAENQYIRSVAVVQAVVEPEPAAPKLPSIYSEFEFVSSSTHTVVPKGDKPPYSVPCEFWRCRNTSGKCKHRDPIKVVKKGTAKIRGHLRVCNPAAFLRVREQADGAELDEDGKLIEELPFKEMLPAHVDFTIMIIMEWDNLWKCRSKTRRAWARRLRKGSRLPARETCIKIMQVIKGLMARKLDGALAQVISDLGLNCIGAQDDIWSQRNCREVRVACPPRARLAFTDPLRHLRVHSVVRLSPHLIHPACAWGAH